MHEEDVVRIYSGILPSHERECINAMCSNINEPGIVMPNEESQTNIIYYHLYVESLKRVQMNLFIKQK